ncbi:PTS sugar transporter subunit IIA [Olsenella sp. Marseille-P4559]|uniref:PTS sugar transporter subunit IIA n=1 Tax=Olsenella sp. Marseille-P4559 TaxID=2364795 RepID=UPI0010324786|nr:PTS sugar transporter subunit IIA [Olsenella sp. Marseille-P4559]
MSEFVSASHVYLDNPATNVDEVLHFLADKFVANGVAASADDIYKAFKNREEEGTTGMMGGFAIPHAKCPGSKEASVVVVKFAGDVDWNTMDGNPVHCAIALLIPEGDSPAPQLRVLSKAAVLLMDADFRQKVLDSTSADEIASIINDGLGQ